MCAQQSPALLAATALSQHIGPLPLPVARVFVYTKAARFLKKALDMDGGPYISEALRLDPRSYLQLDHHSGVAVANNNSGNDERDVDKKENESQNQQQYYCEDDLCAAAQVCFEHSETYKFATTKRKSRMVVADWKTSFGAIVSHPEEIETPTRPNPSKRTSSDVAHRAKKKSRAASSASSSSDDGDDDNTDDGKADAAHDSHNDARGIIRPNERLLSKSSRFTSLRAQTSSSNRFLTAANALGVIGMASAVSKKRKRHMYVAQHAVRFALP